MAHLVASARTLVGRVFRKTADAVGVDAPVSEGSRRVAITAEMRRTAARASRTASSPSMSERSARNSRHKTTVEREVLTSWQARATRSTFASWGSG
jgi:hypothetical protein